MKNSQLAIAELIKLVGYTQREICEKSGFAISQFSYWKSGKKNITLENFIHLCTSNGVNPETVLIKVAESHTWNKIKKQSK